MASWGDLNARLNGLVRAGIISAFRTNVGTRAPGSELAVVVRPPEGAPAAAEGDHANLRRRVGLALATIAPGARISIEDEDGRNVPETHPG